MLTSQIEAVLKSVVLDSSDEKRIAKCALHISPLTYDLAKELSPHVAENLFRKLGEWKWEPRFEVTHIGFNETFPPQRMEFRPAPDVAIPGGFFPGVEIRGVQAFRPKEHEDFTLVLGIRLEIGERQVASKFLIDLYKQHVYLTFSPMQRELSLNLERPQEKPLSGQFITERAKAARGSFRGQAGL
jgi:hypothetical protein